MKKTTFIVLILYIVIIMFVTRTYAVGNEVQTSNNNDFTEANNQEIMPDVMQRLEEVNKRRFQEMERLSLLPEEDTNRLNQEAEQFQSEMKNAEYNYIQQTENFKKRIIAIYQNTSNIQLESIIKAKNLTELKAKIEYLSLINKKDKEMIESLELAKRDFEFKKNANGQRTSNTSEVEKTEFEDKLQKALEWQKKVEANEKEIEKQSEELESKINEITNNGGYYAGGDMVWPVPCSGNITSVFGYRISPITNSGENHTGIDISAPTGSDIVAANSGKVILAGWQGGYGNCIIIDHGGGVVTLYGHCSEIWVQKEQEVEKGSVIGKVGSTGWSTGPHLHFEVRRVGKPVNPTEYVKYQ